MLNANRYKYLVDYVSTNFCTNILEIGTNRGFTAKELLLASINKDINYFGIDLFEDITPEIFKKESSIETWPRDMVKEELKSLRIGKIKLYKGFSKSVLPTISLIGKIDMIFIDGGHSFDTIITDIMYSLNLIKPGGVIFIDDYSDELPDVKKAVDELYCKLKKEILEEHTDTYRGYLYRMVRLS